MNNEVLPSTDPSTLLELTPLIGEEVDSAA